MEDSHMEPLKKHGMDLSKLVDAVLREAMACQSQIDQGKEQEDAVQTALDRINESLRAKE